MLNIDVGGSKGPKQIGGEWKILDIREDADYIYDLNSRELFPFKDEDVNNIYCSNTLEHGEPTNIEFILKEFFRILKSEGKCRIVVPDCAYAINLYINNPKELCTKKYCSKSSLVPSTRMGHLSAWFHTIDTGHKIGFDEELLRAFISRTKFKNIKKTSYNDCSKIFVGRDYEHYAGWNLYLEMEK